MREGDINAAQRTFTVLRHLTGGLDLAAEAAGIEIAAMCEIEPFCRMVLRKHWPEMPIFHDICEVRGDEFGRVDIIFGGFPCQPVSVAGKQRGEEDSRWLWPEFARVVSTARPAWVLAENVENAVRTVLDSIISDLENIGYEVGAYCTEAYCSGAWFKGARVFVVAASDDRRAALRGNAQLSANAEVGRSRGDHRGRAEKLDFGRWREEQSRPYGVADGIPHRVDRLRALGNAVVPQQAYPLFRAIAEMDEERRR